MPASVADRNPADLADQVELCKISPRYLTTEELSRLWSALQARYRPSMAYDVSVVLIEATTPVKAALPVRAPALTVAPITRSVDRPDRPTGVARGRDRSPIEGSSLKGEVTAVLVGGRRGDAGGGRCR